ncbi:uncharacterized protein LOC131191579 [Ahaetulla prasina]|uniref:uncharacterized protein LOC131191579 n=1 Tax=Ahaetulla prasina TaxID=499056 RepID=UPI0026486AE4|nr:uncharacterized protein LOC131191579 [Ahaetulla prasina]
MCSRNMASDASLSDQMEVTDASQPQRAATEGSKSRCHKTRSGSSEAATKSTFIRDQVQPMEKDPMVEPDPSSSFLARALSPQPSGSGSNTGRPSSTPINLVASQGDRQTIDQVTEMPELVRKWIAEAVHRELEAGKSRNRQSVLGAEAQSQDRDQVETEPADGHMGSRSDSSDSPSEAESSPSMEDEQWDQELSEEEGFLPEQPMFKGLFRPHLFKALLSKAKAVTKQGLLGEQSACPEQDPADMLFSEPTVETETVPAPKLFLDMIKKQWEAPAALLNMSSLERRFFNTASDLMELLRVPEVDDPVLALASSSATLVLPPTPSSTGWTL